VSPELLQLGVAGVVAVFAIGKFADFAKAVLVSRRIKTADLPDRREADSRIGQILDRLTEIETQLGERERSGSQVLDRIERNVEAINNRMRDVEIAQSALQARGRQSP
jgi:hypothetical protein